jgi:ankyrin repeat protein
MIRHIGLIILYILLGISIGAFELYVCRPFIKNMTDKLFPLEKICHKPRLHVFADLVTAMLSAIGSIIIAIPMVYLLATAKHFPLNLAFLNLICALALTIGYSIAGKLKHYFDIRRTFTSTAIRASFGRSIKLKRAIENGIDVNESHVDGVTALMLAARNCKVENVRLLIEAGANIRAIDHNGNTVLIWASVLGNIKILQMLIDAGSDINAKNRKGETALDIASSFGFMNKRAIGLLSQYGALKGNELQ